MPSLLQRLSIGFVSGALSHLLFQGALSVLLKSAGIIPALVWSLAPVPPFGVPTLINNMFWDGLWGIIYALVQRRLTMRVGRVLGGAIFGLAPLLVSWFVVLPLKGHYVGLVFESGRATTQLLFDITFGIGIALLFTAGNHLAVARAGSAPTP